MGLGDAARDGSASFVLLVVLTGCGGSFKLLANRRVKKVVPPRFGIALSFSACAPAFDQDQAAGRRDVAQDAFLGLRRKTRRGRHGKH